MPFGGRWSNALVRESRCKALADAFGISIATLNDRSKRYSVKLIKTASPYPE